MSANYNKIVSSTRNSSHILNTDDNKQMNSDSGPPPLPPRPNQHLPYQTLVGYNQRIPYYSTQNGGYLSNNMDYTANIRDVTNLQQPQDSASHPYYNQCFPAMTNTYQTCSNFYKILENSSSDTFKSISSIILALNSVVNVLETTMNAFYTTFQAIFNVIDRFAKKSCRECGELILGRLCYMLLLSHIENLEKAGTSCLGRSRNTAKTGCLKRIVSQMVPSLAVVKFVRWIFRRFITFTRVNKIDVLSVENTWNSLDGSSFHVNEEYQPHFFAPKITSLSSITSLALVVGGPILLYKLLKNIASNMEESRRWATGESDHFSGTALYDFSASNSSEISFNANQTLRIAPKELQPPVRGWLLASIDDGQEVGFVPANHINIHGKVAGSKYPR